MEVVVNQVRCKVCDDVISSNYTHDYKRCSCDTIFIDGGREYQRFGWKQTEERAEGPENYVDTSLSTYKKFLETSFQMNDIIDIVVEVNEQVKEMKQTGNLYEAIHYEQQLKGHLAQIVLLKKEMNKK